MKHKNSCYFSCIKSQLKMQMSMSITSGFYNFCKMIQTLSLTFNHFSAGINEKQQNSSTMRQTGSLTFQSLAVFLSVFFYCSCLKCVLNLSMQKCKLAQLYFMFWKIASEMKWIKYKKPCCHLTFQTHFYALSKFIP